MSLIQNIEASEEFRTAWDAPTTERILEPDGSGWEARLIHGILYWYDGGPVATVVLPL